MTFQPQALVVGSGVIGLQTALELLKRNIRVVLKSPRPPWHAKTCSQGAGGLWMPFHCDDKRTDRWAHETLQHLLDCRKHVEIVPTISLQQNHEGPKVEDFVSSTSPLPKWTQEEQIKFQHLSIEMLQWQNNVLKLSLPESLDGYKYAWLFYPPIVDAPQMLKSMLSEVRNHEIRALVDIEMGYEYGSLSEMVEDARSLNCQAVVNCTGLASQTICHDDSLVGARGILLHYKRQLHHHNAAILVEDGPWATQEEPSYIIPRGDTLVVGGSYLEHDTRKDLTSQEVERLKQVAAKLAGIPTSISPIGQWTGFRPYRPTVRLEIDSEYPQVVHNYGHGGSGWTVFVGAAKEAAELATSVCHANQPSYQ